MLKEYRGDVVENVHYGSIAIVSSTGETIAYTGDIERQTYMRSASKPIQVLPTLLAGLHKKYNLSEEEERSVIPLTGAVIITSMYFRASWKKRA